MKMKQLKPILITAIVLVVLAVAAWLAFKFILPNDDQGKSGPIGPNDANYIVYKTPNMVKSIEVKPRDEKPFKVTFTIDEAGNQTSKLTGEGEEFKYNNDDLFKLPGYVAILIAIEEVENPQGRDSEFGFDNPRQTLKLEFTDDEKFDLILGNDAPSGEGVYIKRSDNGRVFLIGGDNSALLTKKQIEYRDVEMYEAYTGIDAIKEVSITRPGQSKITVRRIEDAAPVTEENPTSAQYQVTAPDVIEADNFSVESKLLTPLIAIKSAEIIEDYPKNLNKYGLSSPTIVTFNDKYGDSHTLKIGSNADAGGNYIMCDDIPTVYRTAETVPFLNIKHTDFTMNLLWFYNWDTVSKIDYVLPGNETHTFIFTPSIASATGVLDGVSVSSEFVNDLFVKTIQFEIQGSVDGAAYGETECKITTTFKNGNVSTFELKPINERYYAASIDGAEPRYYVNVNQLKELYGVFSAVK